MRVATPSTEPPGTPSSTTLSGTGNKAPKGQQEAATASLPLAPWDKEYGDAAQRSPSKKPAQLSTNAAAPKPSQHTLGPEATATSGTPGSPSGLCRCLRTEDALLAPSKQGSTRSLHAASGNAAPVSWAS